MPGALGEVVPPMPSQASPERLQKQSSSLDPHLAPQGGQVGAPGFKKAPKITLCLVICACSCQK